MKPSPPPRHLAGTIGGMRLRRVVRPAADNAAAPVGWTARQPNIVLILSDQHGYKYTGFAGHRTVRTPNLDRIAKQGVVFDSTYCGSPVCAPSRAGMLSGVYPSDCNSFCNATVWDGSFPAWPALLRDAGYRTFGTGKMDTHEEFALGFQEAIGIENDHWRDPDITGLFRRPLCVRNDERKVVNGRARNRRHHDGELAARTVEFIRRQRAGEAPWAA